MELAKRAGARSRRGALGRDEDSLAKPGRAAGRESARRAGYPAAAYNVTATGVGRLCAVSRTAHAGDPGWRRAAEAGALDPVRSGAGEAAGRADATARGGL